MSDPVVPHGKIERRQSRADAKVGIAERAALARNPNDIQAAVRLGEALLAANDPHLARLALAQAIQGGGAEVQNLYGVACARAGDYEGAASGFGKAAIAGLSAGIENANKLLATQLGVPNIKQLTGPVWVVTTSGGVKW